MTHDQAQPEADQGEATAGHAAPADDGKIQIGIQPLGVKVNVHDKEGAKHGGDQTLQPG